MSSGSTKRPRFLREAPRRAERKRASVICIRATRFLSHREHSPPEYQAIALAGLDRGHEAPAAIEKAIALNTTRSILWFRKGSLLQQLGLLKEALPAYHQSINLEPKNPETRYNVGMIRIKLGRNQEAVEAIDKSKKLKSAK